MLRYSNCNHLHRRSHALNFILHHPCHFLTYFWPDSSLITDFHSSHIHIYLKIFFSLNLFFFKKSFFLFSLKLINLTNNKNLQKHLECMYQKRNPYHDSILSRKKKFFFEKKLNFKPFFSWLFAFCNVVWEKVFFLNFMSLKKLCFWWFYVLKELQGTYFRM